MPYRYTCFLKACKVTLEVPTRYVFRNNRFSNTNSTSQIHLHGHDFAILQQNTSLTFPNGLHPKFDNPPRRDVVLLPTNGYVIIAFKTDNPGPWVMHCHIAAHASFGLAVQILERQSAASNMWPDLNNPALLQTQRTCNNWNAWWGNCSNWWHDPNDKTHKDSCDFGEEFFSPDSGI